MTTTIAPNTATTATILRWLTLREDGSPVNTGEPDSWQEADNATPELVNIGSGILEVTNVGDDALATAVLASDDRGLLPTMKAIFEPSEPDGERPQMGDLLSVSPANGVSLLFAVQVTYADLYEPSVFDLGPAAEVNEQLAALQPGEMVLSLHSGAPNEI